MPPLENGRHEAFCREYLVDQNACAAYLRAGYKGHGQMLKNRAHALRHRPGVEARIAELVELRLAATDLKVEHVFAQLKYALTFDITSVVGWDAQGKPTYTPSSELTPAQRAAIQEVTFSEVTHPRGRVERSVRLSTPA
jgi:hypothetical protein